MRHFRWVPDRDVILLKEPQRDDTCGNARERRMQRDAAVVEVFDVERGGRRTSDLHLRAGKTGRLRRRGDEIERTAGTRRLMRVGSQHPKGFAGQAIRTTACSGSTRGSKPNRPFNSTEKAPSGDLPRRDRSTEGAATERGSIGTRKDGMPSGVTIKAVSLRYLEVRSKCKGMPTRCPAAQTRWKPLHRRLRAELATTAGPRS